MQQENWVKTLLSVYERIDKVVYGIDKTFNKICFGSFSYNSAGYRSTYEVSNKLIDLSERKILLINTKLLIKKFLSSLGKKSRELLILRYIKRLKNEDIASLKKCSIRTISRKITECVTKCANYLSFLGYDNNRLRKMYSGEQWILDNYYSNKKW